MTRLFSASCLAVLMLSVHGGALAMTWNFDGDETGKLAKGFSNESGAWQVAKDETAPSKPNVLAQTATEKKKAYNVALAAESSFKDVELSVKMKAVAGEEDQGGGLVWRAKDGANYYIARFNPLEDNFRVYKVVDGVRKQLGTADLKAAPGWHALRVVMVDDHITCYFDGVQHLDVKDSTFKEAGKIGLWSKSDAQTHFDDLTASEPK
ncbi:MAG: family 16 glycoside hydrolase [Planctomycetota bacterium]